MTLASVKPKISLAETYMAMDEIDIGRMASGGFGIDKRKQFAVDVHELARLARKAEIATASGGGRLS